MIASSTIEMMCTEGSFWRRSSRFSPNPRSECNVPVDVRGGGRLIGSEGVQKLPTCYEGTMRGLQRYEMV